MRRNSAVAVVSGVCLTLAFAGCGGSDSKSTTAAPKSMKNAGIGSQGRSVVGGSVTFTTNADTEARLAKDGIKFASAKNSSVKGSSVIVPVSSGSIIVSNLIGSAHGPGSVVFAANGKKVAYTNIVVNTRLRRVSGVVNGKRSQLYHMSINNLKHANLNGGSISGTGITTTLSKQAASRLNKGLDVTTFKKGLKMGTITMVVVTKKGAAPVAKPAKPAPTAKPGTTTSTTTAGK